MSWQQCALHPPIGRMSVVEIVCFVIGFWLPRFREGPMRSRALFVVGLFAIAIASLTKPQSASFLHLNPGDSPTCRKRCR